MVQASGDERRTPHGGDGTEAPAAPRQQQQQQQQEQVVAVAKQGDCFECRMSGSLMFAAMGAWILFQRDQIRATRRQSSNRQTMTVFGLAFFGLSAARWFM